MENRNEITWANDTNAILRIYLACVKAACVTNSFLQLSLELTSDMVIAGWSKRENRMLRKSITINEITDTMIFFASPTEHRKFILFNTSGRNSQSFWCKESPGQRVCDSVSKRK